MDSGDENSTIDTQGQADILEVQIQPGRRRGAPVRAGTTDIVVRQCWPRDERLFRAGCRQGATQGGLDWHDPRSEDAICNRLLGGAWAGSRMVRASSRERPGKDAAQAALIASAVWIEGCHDAIVESREQEPGNRTEPRSHLRATTADPRLPFTPAVGNNADPAAIIGRMSRGGSPTGTRRNSCSICAWAPCPCIRRLRAAGPVPHERAVVTRAFTIGADFLASATRVDDTPVPVFSVGIGIRAQDALKNDVHESPSFRAVAALTRWQAGQTVKANPTRSDVAGPPGASSSTRHRLAMPAMSRLHESADPPTCPPGETSLHFQPRSWRKGRSPPIESPGVGA